MKNLDHFVLVKVSHSLYFCDLSFILFVCKHLSRVEVDYILQTFHEMAINFDFFPVSSFWSHFLFSGLGPQVSKAFGKLSSPKVM